MLVNRDYAISSFKKEKYHVVRLDVGGVAALSERQDDEAAARQMKAACEKSQAVCTSLKKEKKTAAPPKLFDLTALQRDRKSTRLNSSHASKSRMPSSA